MSHTHMHAHTRVCERSSAEDAFRDRCTVSQVRRRKQIDFAEMKVVFRFAVSSLLWLRADEQT